METALGWLARVPAGLVFLVCVGVVMVGLALLVDRSRKHRQETTDLQIALTDAIYAEYGSIAAPLVKDPLWGRRRIQLAVRPDAVGTALVAAHEMLSVADRMKLRRYEVVLAPDQAQTRAARSQSAEPWSPDTRATA